ncbi:MAG TPA: hypothetical protein VFZ49_03605 [Pyrinomonadaceae bacterium]
MQRDKTPMPDVNTFDPNIDPGERPIRDTNDGLTDEDLPLPPDVKDRESIEEPDPEPPAVENPDKPQKQIV